MLTTIQGTVSCQQATTVMADAKPQAENSKMPSVLESPSALPGDKYQHSHFADEETKTWEDKSHASPPHARTHSPRKPVRFRESQRHQSSPVTWTNSAPQRAMSKTKQCPQPSSHGPRHGLEKEQRPHLREPPVGLCTYVACSHS